MKTKEQVRVNLEKWLDRKAEKDMLNAVNGTDPYTSTHNDIFDIYREEDSSMDDLYDEVMFSGVDTREPQY